MELTPLKEKAQNLVLRKMYLLNITVNIIITQYILEFVNFRENKLNTS